MNLNLTHASRIGLNVVALLGASVALYLGKTIFIPIVIAAILAVILWPAASWLTRRLYLPWMASCFTVITCLIVVNLFVFIGISATIPRLLQDLPNPNDIEQQKELYGRIRMSIESISPGSIEEVLPKDADRSSIFAYIRKTLQGEFITQELISLTKLALTWAWQSVLILFILLFLLLEGEMLAKRIKEIFGAGAVTQSQVTRALGQMAEAVRAYLVWRTIVNCGLGIFLGLVYQLLGLRQPWTWALITAVLCYVPYLGTILAGIPPVLDAIIYCSGWHALAIIFLYTVVVTFEGYIIVPVVMGRSMDLNATTVMASCLFWDLIWGMPGLFLAMPLMAGVRAICMNVEGWEAWGNLMSTSRWVEASVAESRARMLTSQVVDAEATVIMDAEPPNNGAPDSKVHKHNNA
jgi:predicted PurR-regulated permease PerM